MPHKDRFALAALLDEMRVFFHRDPISGSECVDWFARNYRELAELTSTYLGALPREDVARLYWISETQATDSKAIGLRTRAERLGEH